MLPEDYVDSVKEMHSKGGRGSVGWRYDWKLQETKKNILRTHTTAVSSRMLYKLAQVLVRRDHCGLSHVQLIGRILAQKVLLNR